MTQDLKAVLRSSRTVQNEDANRVCLSCNQATVFLPNDNTHFVCSNCGEVFNDPVLITGDVLQTHNTYTPFPGTTFYMTDVPKNRFQYRRMLSKQIRGTYRERAGSLSQYRRNLGLMKIVSALFPQVSYGISKDVLMRYRVIRTATKGVFSAPPLVIALVIDELRAREILISRRELVRKIQEHGYKVNPRNVNEAMLTHDLRVRPATIANYLPRQLEDVLNLVDVRERVEKRYGKWITYATYRDALQKTAWEISRTITIKAFPEQRASTTIYVADRVIGGILPVRQALIQAVIVKATGISWATLRGHMHTGEHGQILQDPVLLLRYEQVAREAMGEFL